MYRTARWVLVHTTIITLSSCVGCWLQPPVWESNLDYGIYVSPSLSRQDVYEFANEMNAQKAHCPIVSKQKFMTFEEVVDKTSRQLEGYIQSRLCAEYSVQEVLLTGAEDTQIPPLFQQIHTKPTPGGQSLQPPTIGKLHSNKRLMIYYDNRIPSTFLLHAPQHGISAGLQPQTSKL